MDDKFIRTYDAFEPEYCEAVVRSFEDSVKMGCVNRRNNRVRIDNQFEMSKPESFRDPESDITPEEYQVADMRNSPLCQNFFNIVNEKIHEYQVDMGLDGGLGDIYIKNMLVQRNVATDFESYSTWHSENSSFDSAERAFVYMLYLNDDFEGGETEFKYQMHKEKPKTGKLVIWPPGYTHTHRGAMLTSGVKYIATGWAFWAPGG